MLRTHQQLLTQRFGTQSGRAVDKLAAIPWQTCKTGASL
ncbi:flavin reductase, partial [Paraburkholderia phytofirmans]